MFHNPHRGGHYYLVIQPTAPFSGDLKVLELSQKEVDAFSKWENGALVQDAFPDWSDDKRELLLTGLNDAEFKRYTGIET
jgi:hypothetical protein